jgi:hypothetical protein
MPKLMTAKWRCEQSTLDEEKSRQKVGCYINIEI